MAMEQIDHSLSVALGERDPGTREHCERVIRLSVALGEHISLTGRELTQLRLGARLHDIGKSAFPTAFSVNQPLSKPTNGNA